jgi:hypothetical protein
MKLRWHWTLDESNPKRVDFTEYARAVGRDRKIISRDAYAWEEYQQAKMAGPMGPGSARTPSDFRQLAKLSEERKQATKAIARVSGKAISTVATSKRDEVDAVVSLAQERAMKRKTTVEHEIEHVAERRERGRQVSDKLKKEQKHRHTARYIAAEGDIGVAMQRLRKLLDDVEGVDFNDDERELLTEALGKLRALLNLLDIRITGATDIDWDKEFQKITE